MDWITTFKALKSVYIDGAFSNIAINEAIEQHQGCSNGFVRTFTKGVIRDTIKLDYYIDRLAAKGIKGIKNRTLIIIRMGIYAIESLDSVPDHAACNEAVKLAKRVSKGSDKFVNGILRSFIRERENLLPEKNFVADSDELYSIRYSFPVQLVKLVRDQYGDEAEKLLDALNQPAAMVVRTNLSVISRDDLLEELASSGISAIAAPDTRSAIICEGGNILGHPAFRDGKFSVQSLSSITAIEHLDPTAGAAVLDMCAAPGGKTCAMAEMMGGGSITACDVYPHRLDLIDAQARRLGIDFITTKSLDGTVFCKELENCFDYVLADVPCSGLGVIPSKPEIKLRINVDDYAELTDIQLAILRNALRYAKPGGIIEYSTCTINRNENDGIIERFLDEVRKTNNMDADSGNNAANEGRNLVEIIEKSSILPYNNKIGFYFCLMEKL